MRIQSITGSLVHAGQNIYRGPNQWSANTHDFSKKKKVKIDNRRYEIPNTHILTRSPLNHVDKSKIIWRNGFSERKNSLDVISL